MTETVFRTDWRNIGVWLNVRYSFHAGLMTPWGNVIVKPWADRLFSERYTNKVPHFRLFGLCVSWVRLRRFASLADAIEDIEPQSTPLMESLRKPSPPPPM